VSSFINTNQKYLLNLIHHKYCYW